MKLRKSYKEVMNVTFCHLARQNAERSAGNIIVANPNSHPLSVVSQRILFHLDA
jgi:hypothetical protein